MNKFSKLEMKLHEAKLQQLLSQLELMNQLNYSMRDSLLNSSLPTDDETSNAVMNVQSFFNDWNNLNKLLKDFQLRVENAKKQSNYEDYYGNPSELLEKAKQKIM